MAQTMFALSLPRRRKHTSLVRSIMTISLPFGPAGLPQVLALYYVPSRMLNAFAVGQSEEVAIALTDGLLRHLTCASLPACWLTRSATCAIRDWLTRSGGSP